MFKLTKGDGVWIDSAIKQFVKIAEHDRAVEVYDHWHIIFPQILDDYEKARKWDDWSELREFLIKNRGEYETLIDSVKRNQKLRELIDEYELGIFIETNGRMVTHEFIDNMRELQKLLTRKK